MGGSLLDLPDLCSRWQRFVQVEQLSGRVLMIVGGGNVVEAVRHYDLIHHLDQIESHWLCVDLMNSTAQLLAQLLKKVPVLTQPAQLESWLVEESIASIADSQLATAVVAPAAFYNRELRSESLPIGWRQPVMRLVDCWLLLSVQSS